MASRDESRRTIRALTGLPAGRIRVLRRLGDGPRTLSELAELIGSDAPATTVTVNDLEDRGLVLREPHPTNRRAKLVSLTASGRAVLARAMRIIDATPPAFSAISGADRAALARILDALSGSEDAASPSPREPREPK
ncbi:MAG TPA: MarR family transcriptional regulator [Kofleriaceae bacterium]|jgi:DNA-binding MarR family transcriptional regulator|nr:MarR family transcriptional regulator [Kofleriaceae bacterium]